MKSTICTLALLTHSFTFGQGRIFSAGEVYSFEFTPPMYQQSPVGSGRFNSSFSVYFGTNTLDEGESLLIEMFPNSLSDIPLLSQIETGATDGSGQGFGAVSEVWLSTAPPYWPDLQGFATMTMLSSVVELSSLSSVLRIDTSIYSHRVTIPESTVASFSIVALGICLGFRIGKLRLPNPLQRL